MVMNIENLLKNKRSGIIKKWNDVILETYPKDTQRFFKKEKDGFANPVGLIITKEMETIYDEMVKWEDKKNLVSAFDKIVRIRAVQDFDPSGAVGFVLRLRKIIRNELENISEDHVEGLEEIEDRIDEMALIAFDIYEKCRQKIYDLRVNEVRNQVGRLLERANLTCEIGSQE